MSKGVIDYAFKSYVINNHSDLLVKQRRASLLSYAKYNLIENGVYSKVLTMPKKYSIDNTDLWFHCIENGLQKEYRECMKINKAYYNRAERLKSRVSCMLNKGDCIFITMTFNDNALNSTTDKQRRVAVSRFLKSCNGQYVANVDYGSKNHREHYHALIQCSCIDLSNWRKYGNINVERVRLNDSSSSVRLSKYIAKLTNHAIKETTKRSCLIYSR